MNELSNGKCAECGRELSEAEAFDLAAQRHAPRHYDHFIRKEDTNG